MAYSLQDKKEIIERISRLYVEENSPIEDACLRVNISIQTFYNWTKKSEIEELDGLYEIWRKAKLEALDRYDEIAFAKVRDNYLKKVVTRLRKKNVKTIPDPTKENSNNVKNPKLIVVQVDFEEVEGSDALILEGMRKYHPAFKENAQIEISSEITINPDALLGKLKDLPDPRNEP